MLWMAKMIDGQLAVYRAGGLTQSEFEAAERDRWVFYWSVEREALRTGARVWRESGVAA